MLDNTVIPLCHSNELSDGGLAVPFDVIYGGQTCRAFAIRFKGVAHAYLNRCSHVAMEMDTTGQFLICSTHGALYRPDSGACAGGPCNGGLIPITLSEQGGVVHWHTDFNLKPFEFT
jgi:nitrite reductase/ring-hydroxylating ferredoxin subunit